MFYLMFPWQLDLCYACLPLSHDVAAPLTPTNQEVAGYINYSAQFVPYLGWRLVRNSFPGPYRIGTQYIDCIHIILNMCYTFFDDNAVFINTNKHTVAMINTSTGNNQLEMK